MAQSVDYTNMLDGNNFDQFMSRVDTGVQLSDESLFNPTSSPVSDTTSTSTTKDDPYIDYLKTLQGPSYATLNDNGNSSQVPIKSGSNVGDFWINTFIRSVNWKSKSQGFFISGINGYAEFSNVYVTGDIHALTGEIGGFIIDATSIRSLNALGNTTGLTTSFLTPEDIANGPPYISFFAGANDFADRYLAPFRVYNDGTAHIGGFNIGLNTFISDLGNIEFDQVNDKIRVGSSTGQRVELVSGGNAGIINFYNSNNTFVAQMAGVSTPDGFQILGLPGQTMRIGVLPDTYIELNESNSDTILLNKRTVCQFNVDPNVSGIGLGTVGLPWDFAIIDHISCTDLGANDVSTDTFSNTTKSTFHGSVTACPLPTFEDALEVIRKIPNPVKVGNRGHYGDILYFDDLTFPVEALYEIEGKMEIEHTHMIGLLMQAVRQLTEKVDELEERCNNKGLML